jgi:hypothetical protein
MISGGAPKAMTAFGGVDNGLVVDDLDSKIWSLPWLGMATCCVFVGDPSGGSCIEIIMMGKENLGWDVVDDTDCNDLPVTNMIAISCCRTRNFGESLLCSFSCVVWEEYRVNNVNRVGINRDGNCVDWRFDCRKLATKSFLQKVFYVSITISKPVSTISNIRKQGDQVSTLYPSQVIKVLNTG